MDIWEEKTQIEQPKQGPQRGICLACLRDRKEISRNREKKGGDSWRGKLSNVM